MSLQDDDADRLNEADDWKFEPQPRPKRKKKKPTQSTPGTLVIRWTCPHCGMRQTTSYFYDGANDSSVTDQIKRCSWCRELTIIIYEDL